MTPRNVNAADSAHPAVSLTAAPAPEHQRTPSSNPRRIAAFRLLFDALAEWDRIRAAKDESGSNDQGNFSDAK